MMVSCIYFLLADMHYPMLEILSVVIMFDGPISFVLLNT